ncbi:MAG: hypothetical protein MJA27_23310, partial [Pseudanabaenales cyanobacterium]|nr:hypothetical protein [Pseudanabaenales cyanobacterium]
SQLFSSNCIQVGERVNILYPKYGVGRIGAVIAQEEEPNGLQTGYWLVQVEETEIILALQDHEVEPLPQQFPGDGGGIRALTPQSTQLDKKLTEN